MDFLPALPGPHDIPFAAPLWAAIFVGGILGFIVSKIMDYFIPNPDRHEK